MMRFTPLLAAALCAFAASATAADPVVPLPPQELLALLPAAPEGWTTEESRASNDMSAWLIARATRRFTSPAELDSEGKPLPPAQVTYTLTDTGGFTEKIAPFADLEPGPRPDGSVAERAGGHMVLRQSHGDRSRLTLCVAQRFILKVETAGKKAPDPARLLRAVNLSRLAAAAAGPGSGKVPNPVQIVVFDELQPTKSRKRLVSWTTAEMIEQAEAAERASAQ